MQIENLSANDKQVTCIDNRFLVADFTFVSLKQTKTVMKNLKNVLLVDSLSSGATGLLLILIPGTVAELFSWPSKVPFISVGLFLLLFASVIFYEGRKDSVNRSRVSLFALLNALWVAVSLIVVMVEAFDLSGVGYFLIGVVALWVALMAFLQYLGLKRGWQ
ncbi:MAG: hypothetical protein C0490_14790 [Marivirga sp.]|nr:hypothetical protein [Marivirga sp.]